MRKRLVLDANILIRAVLGVRVRTLLECYEENCEFYTALFQDVADIALCDLTLEVIQYAVRGLEAHTLRGMDAIHIGCAS